MNKIDMKKQVKSAFKTFALTIVLAFTINGSINFLVSSLEFVGIKNETMQKIFVSAIIALVFALLKLGIIHYWEKFSLTMQPFDLKISFSSGNSPITSEIYFDPINGEYNEQEIEIEIIFSPKGKKHVSFMKELDVFVKIYFNPELLDIQYVNRWDSKKASFILENRTIEIHPLKQLDIGGNSFFSREHTFKEKFLIKPIRVHNGSTYLDYKFNTKNRKWYVKFLLKKMKLNEEVVNVICREME